MKYRIFSGRKLENQTNSISSGSMSIQSYTNATLLDTTKISRVKTPMNLFTYRQISIEPCPETKVSERKKRGRLKNLLLSTCGHRGKLLVLRPVKMKC
jgi:hypothetical protein